MKFSESDMFAAVHAAVDVVAVKMAQTMGMVRRGEAALSGGGGGFAVGKDHALGVFVVVGDRARVLTLMDGVSDSVVAAKTATEGVHSTRIDRDPK